MTEGKPIVRASKPKALICENSLFMREKIKLLLQESGCDVIAESQDGLEAVQQYRKLKPDLVTMDIVMPKKGNLDGVGALREILKIDQKAKVVMVTAVDQKVTIDDCMSLGASGYLLKPVSADAVSRTIQEIFHG